MNVPHSIKELRALQIIVARASIVVEALATSRKVVGSSLNEVTDIYQFTCFLGVIQPVTETRT
jgi:hypothetical protein